MAVPRRFLSILQEIKGRQSLRGLTLQWFRIRMKDAVIKRYFVGKELRCLFMLPDESIFMTFEKQRLVSGCSVTTVASLEDELTDICDELFKSLGSPTKKVKGEIIDGHQTWVYLWSIPGGRMAVGVNADPLGLIKLKIGIEKT